MTMAAIAAWVYTVKEIHPSGYGFQDIRRCSYPHKIGRFIYGKIGNHIVQDPVHFLMGLPYRQSSDSITVQIQLGNFLGVGDTNIVINRSLIDAEEKLMRIYCIFQGIQTGHLFFAPYKPPGGPCHRIFHILPVCLAGGAFVKSHGNSRTQIGLDLHTFLRSHKDFSSVYMGMEINTFLLDLAQLCQGKHLESAGISKDGTVPVHKLVQSPQLLHYLISRSHMEMIRVGKFHLGFDLVKIHRRHSSLNGGGCTHIHEHRGFNSPVYSFHTGSLGPSFLFQHCIHRI